MNDLEFISTQELIDELTKRTTWAGILITAKEEIKVSIGEERRVETSVYYQNMGKDEAIGCLQRTIDKMETWEN
jgi:hypothetical protein